MSDQRRPDRELLREALLKLEVTQYAKQEMLSAKEDLRELLGKELKEYKTELDAKDAGRFKKAIAVVALLIGSNVLGYFRIVSSVNQQGEELVKKQIAELNKKYDDIVKQQVDALKKSVTARLDQEFQTPRIKLLVEEQAKIYTEGQAKQYIVKRIEDNMAPFHNRISQATTDVESLRRVTFLADEAVDGSRKAYDELKTIARAKHSQSQLADRKITAVNRELGYYNQPFGIVLTLELSKTIDGKSVRITEYPTRFLFQEMESTAISRETRFSVLKDIAIHKPTKEVVAEALRFLRTSNYLPAIAATCAVLREKFGGSIQFMDIDGWISFLEKQPQ